VPKVGYRRDKKKRKKHHAHSKSKKPPIFPAEKESQDRKLIKQNSFKIKSKREKKRERKKRKALADESVEKKLETVEKKLEVVDYSSNMNGIKEKGHKMGKTDTTGKKVVGGGGI
jgi:hypothetical protein